MNLKTLTLGLLVLFFTSFGLGRYFDSQCGDKSCLKSLAESQNGNFHFSFGDFDSDSDSQDVAVLGTASEETFDVSAVTDLQELEIGVVQSDVEIQVGKALLVRAEGLQGKDKFVIKATNNKLSLQVKDHGPDRLYLEVPEGFKGKITLATVSGELELGSSVAPAFLNVNTVSGDFHYEPAQNVLIKEIRLNGVSGDFRFDLNSGFEFLRVQTVSGDVALKIKGKADFDYRMHAISGDFKGVPGAVLREGIAKREIEGTVGEKGKARVEFESISGDFDLSL